MPNTKVTYMYRDASNYKFWGDFFVGGFFKKQMIEEYLFDGEFFIPHEVGLEHLLDMPMNEDDHYPYTIDSLEICEEKEIAYSAEELVERFRIAHIKGWFSSL